MNRISGLILLLYGIVALLISAPFLTQGNSVLLGADYTGTMPLFGVWWTGHALTHNLDLIQTAYLHYPIAEPVLTHLSLPTSLFYGLLQPLMGPFLAYHWLVPIFLTLNASIGYGFFRQRGASVMSAGIGGAIIAFNPASWGMVSTAQFGGLAIFWFILSLWWTDRLFESPSSARFILLLMSLYFTATTSLAFINLLIIGWLPYAIFRARQVKHADEAINQLLTVGLALFALLAIYPLAPLVWSSYSNGYDFYLAPQSELIASISWNGWLILLGIGWLVGLVVRRGHPTQRLWSIIGITSLILFIQPQLAPLALVDTPLAIPITLDFSTTSFFYLALMAIALLLIGDSDSAMDTSDTWTELVIVALGAGLLILLSWHTPSPTSDVPHYHLYDTIAEDAENYAVLEYPFGFRSLATGDELGFPDHALQAQTGLFWHGKRFIGGQSASPVDLAPYQNNPFIQIASLQSIEDETLNTAQDFQHTVDLWRIGYVLIHEDVVDTRGIQQWLTYTGSHCLIGQSTNIAIWRASWHPLGCGNHILDIGAETDELSIGDGWHAQEDWGDFTVRWAGITQTSQLSLWSQTPTQLTFRATSPIEGQQVTVIINGIELEPIDLSTDWADYTLPIPAEALRPDGYLDITLQHASVELIDGRQLSAVYDTLIVETSS